MAKNSNFVRAASRIFDTPLLMRQAEAESIANTFLQLVAQKGEGEPLSLETTIVEDRPVYEVIGKTAIIRVIGPLVQRHDWLASVCGMVAFERLNTHIRAAHNDSNIERVVFEFDTPGGEVSGVVETAELIADLTLEKETIAQVNDCCCSCGYWLAAQCGEIVVTPTSVVGSIGILIMHREYSAAEEAAGVKTTYITFGDKKVAGNQSEPLSDEGEAELQRIVDQMGELFITSVGNGRGDKFDKEDARNSQASVFVGEDAVASGLADRIGYLDHTLRSPLGDFVNTETMENQMGTRTNTKPAATNGAAAETETNIDVDAIKAQAFAEGEASGLKKEGERRAAVRALDSAKDHPLQAENLLDTTDLSAEAIDKVLKGSPPESPSEPAPNGESAETNETTDTPAPAAQKTFAERLAENEAKAKAAAEAAANGATGVEQKTAGTFADKMRARAGISKEA